MRSSIVVAVLTISAAMLPGRIAAAGGCPRAETAFVSAPLIACPAGDSVLRVVGRDASGHPCPNDTYVRFETCPTVQFPPVLGDEGYDIFVYPGEAIELSKMSDMQGRTDFTIRAGGTCPAATVKVYTSAGFTIAYRALASPDQNGDFGVGTEDFALAASKVGTTDPTADFDGDGAVTSADLDILRGHLGHHAPGMATPVVSRTWGTVKLLYR